MYLYLLILFSNLLALTKNLLSIGLISVGELSLTWRVVIYFQLYITFRTRMYPLNLDYILGQVLTVHQMGQF